MWNFLEKHWMIVTLGSIALGWVITLLVLISREDAPQPVPPSIRVEEQEIEVPTERRPARTTERSSEDEVEPTTEDLLDAASHKATKEILRPVKKWIKKRQEK